MIMFPAPSSDMIGVPPPVATIAIPLTVPVELGELISRAGFAAGQNAQLPGLLHVSVALLCAKTPLPLCENAYTPTKFVEFPLTPEPPVDDPKTPLSPDPPSVERSSPKTPAPPQPSALAKLVAPSTPKPCDDVARSAVPFATASNATLELDATFEK
jgi:hypothetical protein